MIKEFHIMRADGRYDAVVSYVLRHRDGEYCLQGTVPGQQRPRSSRFFPVADPKRASTP